VCSAKVGRILVGKIDKYKIQALAHFRFAPMGLVKLSSDSQALFQKHFHVKKCT